MGQRGLFGGAAGFGSRHVVKPTVADTLAADTKTGTSEGANAPGTTKDAESKEEKADPEDDEVMKTLQAVITLVDTSEQGKHHLFCAPLPHGVLLSVPQTTHT